MKYWLLILVFGWISLTSAEEVAPKRILIVSSFHLSHRWTAEFNDTLLKRLQDTSCEISMDFLELNAVRRRNVDFEKKFEPYLKMLRAGEYDLVVAILDDAIDLMLKNYDSFPKDLPIVIASGLAPANLSTRYPSVTGTESNWDPMKNVELGLKLMPKTREVLIVSDDFTSGLYLHNRLAGEIRNFKQCKVTLLNSQDHTTQEMLAYVDHMPSDSFVVFTPWRNFAKDGFHSLENVAAELVKRTRFPYFIITDVLFNYGALGGYVSRGATHGSAAADIISQIFSGKAPAEIPLVRCDCELMVDMAVMREAGLPASVLPENAILLNRRLYLWEQYRSESITILIAFCCVLALLAALFLYHVRFRRLSAQSRIFLNRGGELAKVTYFRGDDAGNVVLLGGNTQIGISLDPAGQPLAEWIVPEERERFHDARTQITSGKVDSLEMVFHSAARGERRAYLMLVTGEKYDNSYLGVLQDVTDIKRAEQEKNVLIESLNNYVDHERIVNRCLAQIVIEDDFEKNVNVIFAAIADRLNCDRLSLGFYDGQAGGAYRFCYEWRRDGMAESSLDMRKVDEMLQQWRPEFERGNLKQIADIPNSEYAAFLASGGGKTMICAPVLIENRLWGVLGIGFCQEYRKISALDETIMRSAAQIIALARMHEYNLHELHRSTREKRMILDNIQIPIWFYSGTGELIRANSAACRLAGRSEEEILREPCNVSFCKTDKSAGLCPVAKVIETGHKAIWETAMGSREYVITAEPIRDEHGNLINIVKSAIDITDSNEGKRQQEKALHAAQAADRAKTFFLASMSHEIRTPLNAVIGFSELLRRKDLTEQERDEYLGSIHLAGKALLELINDVLDLSKLEAGLMPVTVQETDFPALSREVFAVFRHGAQEKQLDLRFECDQMPLLYVDCLRIRQILLNLIGNALKFTQHGSVVYSAHFQRENEETGTLVFRVTDTGCGISKTSCEKIFDPFVQLDTVRGTQAGNNGTGLGLAICRRLIDRMGGDLRLDSEVGKGSCFTVTLSRVRFRAAAVNALAESAVLPEKSCIQTRILLVDDVPMNLKVLSAMLRKLGVECRGATGGREALVELAAFRPDLVLSDLWMPEMNGAELAANIRAIPEFAHLRIIAVTADTEADSNFQLNHFDDVMQKPVSLEKLSNLIKEQV